MRLLNVVLRLAAATCVAICTLPSAGAAQYRQREPMSCPSELLSYPVSKAAPSGRMYTFVSDWRHASNVGSGVTQAYYDPPGAFVWAGIVPDLTSTDGRAVWEYASIYVKCEKIVEYRPNGTIENVIPIYTTLFTDGDVREREVTGCCSGCGSGGGGGGGSGGNGTELVPVTSSEYDPYDPAYSLEVSYTVDGASDCGSGGGETGEGGTQYEPGDYTGGETVDWGTGVGNGGSSKCGLAAQVEFVCIDTYNEETDKWEHWGCGFVTTC